MKIIRYADLVPVSWKNGGGVTREIARQDKDGELGWRLSIADVASEGAFSVFPGLRRILTVIDGPGMLLDRPNLPALAANLFEPVAFSGDEPINGLLPNGPCRDFNVIWNPDFASASVTVASGQSKQVIVPTEGVFGVLCLTGAVQFSGGNALAPLDFAFLDRDDESVSLANDSMALMIRTTSISKP
jgi:uncharacterized protein